MRNMIGMLLVLALCAAGCVSTLTMRNGTTTYERSGLGEIDPVTVSTAGYIDARADTERAWGETLLLQPDLALGYLRDMAFPWRYMYGGYGRGVGATNPCYYGVCGQTVPTVPSGAPAGGVR
jgi:hypothetical protein